MRGCSTPCCALRRHKGAVAGHVGVPVSHRRCVATTKAAHTPAVGGDCPAVAAARGPGAHPCCGARRGGTGACVFREGTGFWACVRVERGSVDWVEVTGSWAIIGNYGTIMVHPWGIMGKFGELWGIMGNYGVLWGIMGNFAVVASVFLIPFVLLPDIHVRFKFSCFRQCLVRSFVVPLETPQGVPIAGSSGWGHEEDGHQVCQQY